MELDYVRYLEQSPFSLQYFTINKRDVVSTGERLDRLIVGLHCLHNCYGPAFIVYAENGMMQESWYYISGMVHNCCGPALKHYNPDGTIEREQFWIHNARYVPSKNKIVIVYYNINGKYIHSASCTLNTLSKYTPDVLYYEHGCYFRVKYWRNGQFIKQI
jgi:hypothetical protein